MALSRRSTVLAALGLAVGVAGGFTALRAWSGTPEEGYPGYRAMNAGDRGSPATADTADVGLALVGAHTGDTITFTVTVRNQGPAELRSVLAHADLPAGTTATSPDCRTGPGVVNCGFVALPAGQEATATFTVPATGGPVTVKVTRLSSTPADPTAGNDEATFTIT
ncbi:MAG: hypothetical protein ACJ73S_05860 [Mycobacteriales bacterium]